MDSDAAGTDLVQHIALLDITEQWDSTWIWRSNFQRLQKDYSGTKFVPAANRWAILPQTARAVEVGAAVTLVPFEE